MRSSFSTALQQEPAGRAFLERFAAFLDAYGHRETGSPLLVSQPTWKDSPQTVLGILKGMARAEPVPRSGPPSWTTARDDVLAHPALRFEPLRALVLRPHHPGATRFGAARGHALRDDAADAGPAPDAARAWSPPGRGWRPGDSGGRLPSQVRRAGAASMGSGRRQPISRQELRQAARRRAARRLELAGTPLMDCCHRSPGCNPAGRSWSRARRAARASPRDRCASCAIRRPSGHSFPARCWSLRTRTRPGRHSSRAPPPLSSIPAPPCRTPPSWRGSTAFPR